MKTYKDIYNPPFRIAEYSSWVYDANSNFVFQFEPKFDDNGNYLKGWKEFENAVIDRLNGNESNSIKPKFRVEKGEIFANDVHVITIRGWGNLTGVGGHNLSPEEATNIQNTFAEFIVEQLNKQT